MNQLINKLKQGALLRPMKNAGKFFEDGFYLSFEKNGLNSVAEVLTSEVLDLERRGILFWNGRLQRHTLTKKGLKETR